MVFGRSWPEFSDSLCLRVWPDSPESDSLVVLSLTAVDLLPPGVSDCFLSSFIVFGYQKVWTEVQFRRTGVVSSRTGSSALSAVGKISSSAVEAGDLLNWSAGAYLAEPYSHLACISTGTFPISHWVASCWGWGPLPSVLHEVKLSYYLIQSQTPMQANHTRLLLLLLLLLLLIRVCLFTLPKYKYLVLNSWCLVKRHCFYQSVVCWPLTHFMILCCILNL